MKDLIKVDVDWLDVTFLVLPVFSVTLFLKNVSSRHSVWLDVHGNNNTDTQTDGCWYILLCVSIVTGVAVWQPRTKLRCGNESPVTTRSTLYPLPGQYTILHHFPTRNSFLLLLLLSLLLSLTLLRNNVC